MKALTFRESYLKTDCEIVSTEHSPLLPNGHDRSTSSRILSRIKGHGEPGWIESLTFFYFGSWFNLLLIFVPLSGLAHFLNWDAGIRFGFSFMAIIPLAKLLGEATEQLALKLGQTLGGLLNASFGNAVEVIVGVAALIQGELRIVQTSMLGSILSNLLLVLGMSFFAGGLVNKESGFAITAAQTSASLMTLACITLVIPAAYHASKVAEYYDQRDAMSNLLKANVPPDYGQAGLLTISRGTAVILLGVYVGYLIFQLKTHAYIFEAPPPDQLPSRGRAEQTDEEEKQKMNLVSAGVSLLVVTLVTSFCADWLVASIEETAEKYHIPKPFIGVILLPLVANAAEHVTSVWMAMKDKMELTITISVGSSIQISSFVVPLLVIVGWIINKDLTLFFNNFETVTLFVSVILVNLLIMDGKSNYMEGVMLIALYIVIALAFWVQ